MKNSKTRQDSNLDSQGKTFPSFLVNIFYLALDMMLKRKISDFPLDKQDNHYDTNTNLSSQHIFIVDRSFYNINHNSQNDFPYQNYHQLDSAEVNKNRARRPQRSFYRPTE